MKRPNCGDGIPLSQQGVKWHFSHYNILPEKQKTINVITRKTTFIGEAPVFRLENWGFLHTTDCHSGQLPIDLYCGSWFGFIAHMADFDTLDHCVQNFRCQFLDVRILAQCGIHFPALHALGK